MGAIAERTKAFIPITWDALNGDSRFGPTMLQDRVERAKYEVLGTAAPIEGAEGALSEDLKEFIAKKSAVKLIPAGIEFWLNQPITKTTTGTNEVVSYESRVTQLRLLLETLQKEILADEPLLNPPMLTKGGYPAVSDGQSDILVTVNPHDIPPSFNINPET